METTTKAIHKFEAAGLGVAPFRCVAVRQNLFPLGDGTSKPGGTCDFCSNGIMWEFVIKGADGRTFKVGSDCVAKTGDAGMIRTSRRMRSNFRTPEQIAAAEAKRAAYAAMREAEAIARAEAVAKAEAEAIPANAWILEALPAGDGGFIDSMRDQLRTRKFADMSPRQIEVLIDVYARTFGRRGSKAYNEAADRAGEYAPAGE